MQIHTSTSEKKESNFFSAFLYRYLPYWPLFVIVTLLCLGGAWAYLRYTVPMYEANATIMIKDEKKGVDESSVLEALKISSGKKIVENEIEVLNSRKLMNEVVKQLHLYAQVYERSEPYPRSAYSNAPIVVEAKDPEAIDKTVQVNFTANPDKGVKIKKKYYPFGEWVSTPYGEMKFTLSQKGGEKGRGKYFIDLAPLRKVTSDLIGHLKVQSSGKLSTVVDLKLRDDDPKRAEDVLNMLVSMYNQSSINDKNSLAANTLAFIETRLQNVEKELDSIEGRIQHYRSTRGVVDLSEQGKQYLESVGNTDRKISEVNMQLAILNQVERYVQTKENKSGVLPSTLGLNDPLLSQLMQRLYQSELEYDNLKKTTAEKHPVMITMANQIEQIRPQILENIRNQRNNLIASKGNLSATSGMYSAMLNTLPIKERQLTEISRQHTIKNNVYSFLLEKREQAAMTISSTVADMRAVDMAIASNTPVSPKSAFVYMVAIVTALGLFIALVSARELLNKKILYRSEIESFTKIPIVAEIAYTQKKESLAKTSSKISYTAEQFRHLRAAIGLYGNRTDENRRIMVTSSIPEEGKSYISVNLAISLALASKKVVIVDLDIRSPKVSAVFGVADKEGVAEFLEGGVQPDQIIRETNYPNLWTISAGGAIENARESILEGKLNELLSYLESHFDYIIMDTSPVNPVPDAYVFSKFCDITLFIVRHGYTPKNIVQFLDTNNKIKGLKNPHIVFNDVRSRGLFVRTYGYGYGYGYDNVYRKTGKKTAKKLLEQ